MAYATTDDIKEALSDVEHLLRDYEINLATQISNAEDWINGYLEVAGVETPLTTPPAFVNQSVVAYTCYLVVRRVNATGAFTELMREFRTEAYRLKDDFCSGAADSPGIIPARTKRGLPSVVNPHRSV